MQIRRLLLPLALLSFLLTPAFAGARLSFDVETLNRVLPALSASRVEVAITPQRSLAVELHDMEIVGLEPDETGGNGRIATQLRVKVPALGFEVGLQPKLLMEIVQVEGRGELELRFDEVPLAVPLAGRLDLAPMLPAMRFPAENLWAVQGATENVAVRSTVTGISMDRRRLQFDFDLQTVGARND